MQFVDIEKKDGGAYLHRYDLHYIDRTGCPRTYEMVSRDRNIDSLTHLQQRGIKAGVVLNPATPVCVLESIIDVVDMVLLMSVNPGFGGQSFIPGTIAKLHELKTMCERHGVSPLIEVDGGISSKNIAEVVKAGANVLVAGSAVFKSEDPAAEVALLQKLGNEAAQEA